MLVRHRRRDSPLTVSDPSLPDDPPTMDSPSPQHSDYDHFSPISVSPQPSQPHRPPSIISVDPVVFPIVCTCEHEHLYARLHDVEETLANDRLAVECLQLSFKNERTTYDLRIAQINARVSRLAHSVSPDPRSFPDRGQWLDLMMRLYHIEAVNDDHAATMQFTIDTINDTSSSIRQCKQALCDLASRLSRLATDTEQALHDVGSVRFSMDSPYLLQRIPSLPPSHIARRARRTSFVL